MRRALTLSLLTAFLLVTAGCGAKLTQENYDKIKMGMTRAEVEDVLGEGEEQASVGINMPGMEGGGATMPQVSESAAVVTWEDGDKKIMVFFEDGKVAGKMQSGL